MGFGDFLAAGASALGVDTDDIGGFFDTAKSALGGDGDAADLFGAAAKQFGIDADDVTSTVRSAVGGGEAGDAVDRIGQLFGGGGGSGGDGGGSGGGFGGVFGGAVSDLLGGGDAGGAAQQAVGGFGSLFGGGAGDILKSVSDQLPSSVTNAFSEAADLPFVQDAANGNWAEMAGSVPGLDGALGSFGLSTKDVAEHIEGMAAQSVDGGSAWSLGNMLADRGAAFLNQVAAPTNADAVWSSLPGLAQKAGVELPNWAQPSDLLQQGGRFLEDGGFAPSQVKNAAELFTAPDTELSDNATILTAPAPVATMAADDTTGESQVATETEPQMATSDGTTASTQAADEFVARDEFASDPDGMSDQQMTAAPPVEPVEPTVEEAPAPAPDQFAATDQLEGDLEGLGDDAFA